MRTYTLLACLALLAASAVKAENTEVTLRVPVNLSELHPDVATVQVRCVMARKEADLDVHMRRVYFNGAHESVDSNGSARFIDEIKTAVSVAYAAQLRFYRCNLSFQPTNGSNKRAIPRSKHTRPSAHPASLPFYVVNNGARVETQGSIAGPQPVRPKTGGFESRRR